ncbi:MAG: hypothetical protein MR016_04590 [Agathobacter sp.]|nr:hypothetical protein [Agathobacter sp.]
MINDTYLKIESNVFPYYFGDDFLLNIGTSDFVKLNCIQEEVIKCSDGGKTYSEIYYHIIDKFGQDDNENTNNGKVRTYKDAVKTIGDILTESDSKLSDIYCNGFCDVRR